MVHVRLNAKELNPNPHINFIAPLRIGDAAAEEDARQLLRALAAQVKPVMRAHGFVVNSFEEYEYNTVFAGRNWNNGETVELVLRNPSGSYYPTSWLISVLCHELAHIKHMNHGPGFQALNTKLRKEVRDLQNKGYYGDGYWSAGTRLSDGARVSGQGLDTGTLPEYMCGGAQTRARLSTLGRRRRRQPATAGPSNHTGAQTSKKRKAGLRVTAKDAFKGEGSSLNVGESSTVGTGFRKQAGSKKAREERALAMERRLKALSQKPLEGKPEPASEGEDGSGSEYDDTPPETDQDRRRALLESVDKSDLDNVKPSWSELEKEFIFPQNDAPEEPVAGSSRPHTRPRAPGPILVIDDSDEEHEPEHNEDDAQILTSSRTTATNPSTSQSLSGPPQKKQKISYGSIVQDEIRQRTKESLGMSGPGRTLSGSRSKEPQRQQTLPETLSTPKLQIMSDSESGLINGGDEWSCLVCTL
ncbi:hypothetical protein QCA50_005789 [Cerrena zonata]|uniref:WLM domain-containing protein n=1 Tax=Cerrena zonata TaxID=2478898 RepID=A0AAW0GBF0_9APHY